MATHAFAPLPRSPLIQILMHVKNQIRRRPVGIRHGVQRAIHDALRRAESRPGEEDGLGCGAGEPDRGYGALDRGAPCVEIGNGMRLVHDAEDDGALVGVLVGCR